MKFDLEKIFEESKRTAKAYSQQVKGILHNVRTKWCRLLILVFMSLEKQEVSVEGGGMAFEGGEDDIGPPLPSQYKVHARRHRVGPRIVKEKVEFECTSAHKIGLISCNRNW